MGRGWKGICCLESLVGVYHLNFLILVQFQTAICQGYLTWNKGWGEGNASHNLSPRVTSDVLPSVQICIMHLASLWKERQREEIVWKKNRHFGSKSIKARPPSGAMGPWSLGMAHTNIAYIKEHPYLPTRAPLHLQLTLNLEFRFMTLVPRTLRVWRGGRDGEALEPQHFCCVSWNLKLLSPRSPDEPLSPRTLIFLFESAGALRET